MDEIDISWTNEYLRTTSGGVTYEPELMNSIDIKILYVDTNQEVFHIIDDSVSLKIQNNEKSVLEENKLISLIHKYKNYNNKKYKCDHIMKYFIPTDPETIIDNISDPSFTFNEKECLTLFDIPQNISFSPSLFIFHSVNSIYLFFHELILVNDIKPISIIKKHNSKKHTKRVRISIEPPIHIQTRKNRKKIDKTT